jgi:hypothetical protein
MGSRNWGCVTAAYFESKLRECRRRKINTSVLGRERPLCDLHKLLSNKAVLSCADVSPIAAAIHTDDLRRAHSHLQSPCELFQHHDEGENTMRAKFLGTVLALAGGAFLSVAAVTLSTTAHTAEGVRLVDLNNGEVR